MGGATRHERRGLVLATIVALSAGVSSAAAQGTLDQSFEGGSGGGAGIEGTVQLAQSFTAGRTGILTQVQLFLGLDSSELPPPVTVDIETVDANHQPSGTVLASSTISADEIEAAHPSPPGFPVWVPAVFAAPTFVVAGTQYAIVLSDPTASAPDDFMFEGFGQNTYSGGYAFLSGRGGTWTSLPNISLDFRTYVESEPISVDQCKNGGWHDFPQFKNQGGCVSYVETGR